MAETGAYVAYVRRPWRMEVISGSGRGYRTRWPTTPPLPPPQAQRKRMTSAPASKKSASKWVDNPDMKRKQRVAKYKLYAVEGQVKSSFKKGIRWIKRKCSRIVHGY